MARTKRSRAAFTTHRRPATGRICTGLGMTALLALGVVACGGDAERSDESEARAGTVRALIQDGPVDAGSASGASTPVRGTFVGNFIVSVFSEEGYWVDIGRGADMAIPLSNGEGGGVIEAAHEIPPGTYSRVRVTLCHSSVEVEEGSRIGERTLDAAADVHLTETGDVIVLRDVSPFTVAPGEDVQLQVDLNADRWLTEEAVGRQVASIPAFEREVAVSVQPEG